MSNLLNARFDPLIFADHPFKIKQAASKDFAPALAPMPRTIRTYRTYTTSGTEKRSFVLVVLCVLYVLDMGERNMLPEELSCKGTLRKDTIKSSNLLWRVQTQNQKIYVLA